MHFTWYIQEFIHQHICVHEYPSLYVFVDAIYEILALSRDVLYQPICVYGKCHVSTC